MNSPAEFKAELNPKEHQIFVIDDIFGEACLNLTLVEQWRPHLEDIMMELTTNLPKTLVIICVNKVNVLLLNPYLTNGFSHHYYLGESTFIGRGIRSDF